MFELIARLARDFDPDLPGLQPSVFYLVLCVLVPVAVGLGIGWLSNVLIRLFHLYKSNQGFD